MAEEQSKIGGIVSELPTDQLKQEMQELLKVVGQRLMKSVGGSMGAAGQKVTGMVQNAGKSILGGGGVGGIAQKVAGAGVDMVKDKIKDAIPGMSSGDGNGGGGGGGSKVTNIVEELDVGVPVDVAYNQWTRFTEFPDFMKKVEKVEQESDTELSWRAQVLWSHRDWKSTIIEQVPDDRIVWRSEGAKGYVDGAVTFHELAPNLTKILLVLQYYPQGLFEKTGNLWRAQGRRARLELKHFRRHVMTETLLHPDEVEGWRGEIHDGEVSQPEEQEGESQEQEGAQQPEGQQAEQGQEQEQAA